MRAIVFFILFWVGFLYASDLTEHIHYSQNGPNYIGHLYVGGHETQISQATVIYVKNALEYYKKQFQPVCLILELNTPGGQVFPAQRISDMLKELDINDNIPVIAYINNWAISAGAMLAYSCRFIVTVKDGTMGAAQPVSQTGESVSEKINSAIRADFGARAAFFDRNPLIAQAMVDADMVLVLREGKVVELASNDDIQITDRVITRKGKLLTLNAQEMIELKVADFEVLPSKVTPPLAAEKRLGQWRAEQMLLFSLPFLKEIPNATIVSYQLDWKTRFFAFLSNPIVSAILFLAMIIGFYIEISTPGFGWGGGIGLISLALLILSSFAVQTAPLLELILLTIGVAFILFEIFVTPGFGVLGIIGILLALIGLGGILLPGIKDVQFDFDSKNLNAAGEFILERIAWLSVALILATIIIVLLARYIAPKITIFSPLLHRGEQEAAHGYVASEYAKELIGKQGEALSPLKPSGTILIEGKAFQAVSKFGYIEKGEKIKVIEGEGAHLIVIPILTKD